VQRGPVASRFVRAGDTLLASPGRVFGTFFVLYFAIMTVWSLATPLYYSPDEGAHIARAVALVRGELIGQTIGSSSNATTRITIPQVYAVGTSSTGCFSLKVDVSAGCQHLTGSAVDVRSTTYVGRYPPLYYAIVGLPSLLVVSRDGPYFMRLVSDLLSAAYLALAVMAVATWSKNRLLLGGLLIAVTPMTLFLSSVVNPNGFEITSATCLWCSGLIIVRERWEHPPPGLIAVAASATGGLVLARGLSLLWVALIALILGLTAGWRAIKQIVDSNAFRWSLVFLTPAMIFAIAWMPIAHSLDELSVGPSVNGATGITLAEHIFEGSGGWLHQMIGVFGTLDTPAPLLTYLLWFAALGAVVLVALACARSRLRLALLLLIGLVVVMPVVISFPSAHSYGIIWQGRYGMPLAVGVPLLAAALIPRDALTGRMRWRFLVLIGLLTGVGQVAALVQNLRRYTVGLAGSFNILHGSWQPPLGTSAVLVTGAVGTVLLVALVWRLFLVVARPCSRPSVALVQGDARAPGTS
jgi:hypothetical protein